MGFVASKVVSKLDYDFNPHVLAKGVVPEPSDKLIARFQRLSAEHAQKYMPDVDFADQKAMIAAAASVTEEESEEAALGTAEIFAELTQGQPSAEELMKLPPRIRVAFYGWLQEEINPEG